SITWCAGVCWRDANSRAGELPHEQRATLAMVADRGGDRLAGVAAVADPDAVHAGRRVRLSRGSAGGPAGAVADRARARGQHRVPGDAADRGAGAAAGGAIDPAPDRTLHRSAACVCGVVRAPGGAVAGT